MQSIQRTREVARIGHITLPPSSKVSRSASPIISSMRTSSPLWVEIAQDIDGVLLELGFDAAPPVFQEVMHKQEGDGDRQAHLCSDQGFRYTAGHKLGIAGTVAGNGFEKGYHAHYRSQ